MGVQHSRVERRGGVEVPRTHGAEESSAETRRSDLFRRDEVDSLKVGVVADQSGEPKEREPPTPSAPPAPVHLEFRGSSSPQELATTAVAAHRIVTGGKLFANYPTELADQLKAIFGPSVVYGAFVVLEQLLASNFYREFLEPKGSQTLCSNPMFAVLTMRGDQVVVYFDNYTSARSPPSSGGLLSRQPAPRIYTSQEIVVHGCGPLAGLALAILYRLGEVEREVVDGMIADIAGKVQRHRDLQEEITNCDLQLEAHMRKRPPAHVDIERMPRKELIDVTEGLKLARTCLVEIVAADVAYAGVPTAEVTAGVQTAEVTAGVPTADAAVIGLLSEATVAHADVAGVDIQATPVAAPTVFKV